MVHMFQQDWNPIWSVQALAVSPLQVCKILPKYQYIFFSGSISVDKQAHEPHVSDWQSRFLFEEVLLFLIVWHSHTILDYVNKIMFVFLSKHNGEKMCGLSARQSFPRWSPLTFLHISMLYLWPSGDRKRDRITGKETRNKWSSTKSQNFVDYSLNCLQFCEFDLNQMFLLHKTEKLVCEHWIKIHVCHVFPSFDLIKQKSYCVTWDSH